jgi:hypothetical protein
MARRAATAGLYSTRDFLGPENVRIEISAPFAGGHRDSLIRRHEEADLIAAADPFARGMERISAFAEAF